MLLIVCHAGSATLLLFLQFCRFVITSSALIKAHPVIRFYVAPLPALPLFLSLQLPLTDECSALSTKVKSYFKPVAIDFPWRAWLASLKFKG